MEMVYKENRNVSSRRRLDESVNTKARKRKEEKKIFCKIKKFI